MSVMTYWDFYMTYDMLVAVYVENKLFIIIGNIFILFFNKPDAFFIISPLIFLNDSLII